jgi:hypothetical protein
VIQSLSILQAVLLARYGPGSAYNISQPEQERFVSILKNALSDTIGSGLTDQDIISIGDHLHQTDAEVVAQENANTCNFGETFIEEMRLRPALSLQSNPKSG